MARVFRAQINKADKNLTDITTECVECHKVSEFSVPTQEWANYAMGQMIQVAMPSVNADHREMILTGVCPTCWEAMFGMDEFEDEFSEEVPD